MRLGWTPAQESGSQSPPPTSLGPQLPVLHSPQQQVGDRGPRELAFGSFSPGSPEVSFLPRAELPVSTLLTASPGAHEAFAPNHSHFFCSFFGPLRCLPCSLSLNLS